MESIIEALAEYFSPKFKDNLKRCENIELLIERLEAKQLCLEEQLTIKLSKAERDSLMTKLAVLKIQQDKAKGNSGDCE